MCGVASIVNLTVISLERLFAVVRPASHRNLSRKTNVIRGAISFVWAFAITNAGLYYIKAFHGWIDYNIYIVVIGFVAPALVIVGSYMIIYHVAQQHVTEQQRLRREMRLAGMIAIVIALFIACWFPFFLLNILFTYCRNPTCDQKIMQKTIPLVKFLHYSNSMMNPLVYAYRNSDYRDAFKKLIYTMCGSKKYSQRGRSSSNRSMVTSRSDFDDALSSGRENGNFRAISICDCDGIFDSRNGIRRSKYDIPSSVNDIQSLRSDSTVDVSCSINSATELLVDNNLTLQEYTHTTLFPFGQQNRDAI